MQNLGRAVARIAALDQVEIVRRSSVYETEPVGLTEQPGFLNMVVEIRTALQPRRLFEKCLGIEQELGRRRTRRWGPRVIDIDILCVEDCVLLEPDFQIPHREMIRRRFVLVPFEEIAGDFVPPLFNQPVTALLRNCPDRSGVRSYCSSDFPLAVEG